MSFKPNPRFEAELRGDPDYRAALLELAEGAVPAVRAAAPHASGDYRNSIEAFDDGKMVGVTSRDFAAHLIEFGSVKNPTYGPLRRGALAAGLRLREHPK